MSILASIFVLEEFLLLYLVISNSVQHDRQGFRQIGGVALGKKGVRKNQMNYPWICH